MAATINKYPPHIKLENPPSEGPTSPNPSPRNEGTSLSNNILAQLSSGMVVTYPTLAQTISPAVFLQANALSNHAAVAAAAKFRDLHGSGSQTDSQPSTLTSPLLNTDKLRLGMHLELCVVCGDRASGRHYGAISCEGCKGFFKRSIRKQLGYQCRGNKDCEVTKHHRNRCQFCRLKKCIEMGMRSDSVQSERKPAHSPSQLNSSIGINLQERLNTLLDSGVFGSSSKADGRVSTTSASPSTSTSEASWGQSINGESIPPHRDIYSSPSYETHFDSENTRNGIESSGSDERSESPVISWDRPVLTELHTLFELTTPSPTPPYLNVHYICESASRLLFLSMHWARSIQPFSMLSIEVQEHQIKNCWVELFALGLAQCAQVMSLTSIFTAIVNHLQASVASDKLTAHRVKQVTEHICTLQEYVNTMLRLSVDDWEFAYLKALLLFSPDYGKPNSKKHLKVIQEKLMGEFRNYEDDIYPDESERMVKLLLRLPPLRALNAPIMEELFFAGLIGQVQIHAVIPYILNMYPKYYSRISLEDYNNRAKENTEESTSNQVNEARSKQEAQVDGEAAAS